MQHFASTVRNNRILSICPSNSQQCNAFPYEHCCVYEKYKGKRISHIRNTAKKCDITSGPAFKEKYL
jgi:hypothetical protein